MKRFQRRLFFSPEGGGDAVGNGNTVTVQKGSKLAEELTPHL